VSAFQALDDVCRHILLRTALYAQKRTNAMTVSTARKWQFALKTVQAKVLSAYHCYHRHWDALNRLCPQVPGNPPAAWREVLQPLRMEDLTALNTNEAKLQEKESIERAMGLAAMTSRFSQAEAGDRDAAGPTAGLWDNVVVYGNLYQHGQQGRRL
jgi:hypothetical protein